MSGAGSSSYFATIRLTTQEAPSGIRSSRHQHRSGSSSKHSMMWGADSTITSPIHEAATSSASCARSGAASTTNEGESCCTRCDDLGGRGGDGAATSGRCCRRKASSYAALSACIDAGSPPWSGWVDCARRRRAAASSAGLASARTPSTVNGSSLNVRTMFRPHDGRDSCRVRL